MNVKEMHRELVSKGLTPKDAAKQIQAKTGLSAVTGKKIVKDLYSSFSKKNGKIIGQYGGS